MRTIAFLVTCVVLLLGAAGIGAQESDVAASDFDGSGKVDFQDFVVFARGFGSASADPGFDARLDLDGSGKVDFQDFVIFAGNFGKSVGETSRTFVYISDLDILGTGGKVDVFDLETNLLHLSITVPWPRGMAYSPSRKRLYVAAIETFYAFTESGSLDFSVPLAVPPEGSDSLAQTAGGYKVAISLDQLYAFVTESDADLVEVIDLQSRISKAQIPVGPGPRGIVANPRANEVYVAKRSGAISIIDAVAHVEIDSIPVGNMGNGRLVVAPDGKRLYVTSSARLPRPEGQDSSTVARVLAIDPGARTVVDTLQLGAVSDPVTEISDLAMSRDGTRVFATLNWDFYQSLGSITTLGRASKFVTIEALGLEIAGELEIAGMERLFGCAVSPDDQTAYVIAKESIFDLTAQVLLLDLVQNESVGALLGLAVPFEIRVPAGKPAGVLSRPELAVF